MSDAVVVDDVHQSACGTGTGTDSAASGSAVVAQNDSDTVNPFVVYCTVVYCDVRHPLSLAAVETTLGSAARPHATFFPPSIYGYTAQRLLLE